VSLHEPGDKLWFQTTDPDDHALGTREETVAEKSLFTRDDQFLGREFASESLDLLKDGDSVDRRDLNPKNLGASQKLGQDFG
jgi:hypothetical protein